MKKSFRREQFKRDEVKKRGFKRFFASWSYSFQGLAYAYKYEQSMLIHFIATIFSIIMGIILEISATEWLLIFISIGMVLAMELLNTAIEAVVDLVTLDIYPLAKIAKDTGSAATFVVSVISFVIGMVIFMPKILDLF